MKKFVVFFVILTFIFSGCIVEPDANDVIATEDEIFGELVAEDPPVDEPPVVEPPVVEPPVVEPPVVEPPVEEPPVEEPPVEEPPVEEPPVEEPPVEEPPVEEPPVEEPPVVEPPAEEPPVEEPPVEEPPVIISEAQLGIAFTGVSSSASEVIELNIGKIEVKNNSTGDWDTYFIGEQVFILTNVSYDSIIEFPIEELTAGLYGQIRIFFNDQNYIYVENEVYKLGLNSSIYNNGLKLNGGFELNDGYKTTLNINIDIEKSIRYNKRSYTLKPTLEISSRDVIDLND